VLACGLSTATAVVTAGTNATASCSPTENEDDNDDDTLITEAAATPVDGQTVITVIEQPFPESILEMDHYDGASLHLERLPEDADKHMSGHGFETALHTALDLWKRENRKGIWIHLGRKHVMVLLLDNPQGRIIKLVSVALSSTPTIRPAC
jgi:hypothetical protein